MTPKLPSPTAGRIPWLPLAALVLLGLGVLGLRARSGPDGSPRAEERASATPTPSDILWLGDGATIDFEPTATLGGDGRLWVVWLAWDESDSSTDLLAACLEGGEVVGSGALATDLELPAAPTVAAFEGGIYAVWEAGAEGARTLDGMPAAWNGSALTTGERERIVEPGYGRLVPQLAAAGDGDLALVWQELVKTSYDVLLERRGKDGWSQPSTISGNNVDEWAPRVAADPDGSLHVVFDVPRGAKGFALQYAHVRDGHDVMPHFVHLSARTDSSADVSVSPEGQVWIAWESMSSFGQSGGLRGTSPILGLARMRNSLPDIVDLDPSREDGKRGELPRVLATDSGPVLAYRAFGSAPPPGTKSRETYGYWRTGLLTFGAGGAPVDGLVTGSDGDGESSESLVQDRDGRIWCVLAGDRRSERYGEIKLWGGSLEGRSRIGVVALDRPAPGAPPLPPPRVLPGGIAIVTGARTIGDRDPLDGRRHEQGVLLFGDLHRHTQLSRCASGRDGRAVDAYRYARGPGKLDFVAITDHYQHLTPFSWWRSLRDVRRYQAPGSLVTFAALERMLGPRGHYNAIYPGIERTAADLEPGDGLGRTPGGAPGGAPQGDPILIPHMMGIQPNGYDWSRFDAEHQRVFEVYQGSRGSYEGPGLPYEASDLRREDASIAAGLRAGHHFGLIASSDHNASGDSFAGVWAADLSRGAIFEALRARRAFASTIHAQVDTRLDGLAMGAEGPARAGAPFHVHAEPLPGDAGRRIHSVEVVKNGAVLLRREGDAGPDELVLSTRHGGDESARPLRVRALGGEIVAVGARTTAPPDFSWEREGDWVRLSRSGWERAEMVIRIAWEPESDRRALVIAHGDDRARVPMDGLPPGTSRRVVYDEEASSRNVKRNSESLWRMGRSLDLAALDLDVPDPERAPGDSYYARILWEDGEISWTSPIRVTEVLP